MPFTQIGHDSRRDGQNVRLLTLDLSTGCAQVA
jgi:hypothetical protein